MTHNPNPQLQMLWPEKLLSQPPDVVLPPDYGLRIFQPDADMDDYINLMHTVGFPEFNPDMVAGCLTRVLPDGLFVIEHAPTRQLVATAMANHAPTSLHPFGGEVGWVAGDPAHAGRGLGKAICAAVVRRFLSAGYKRIYLLTDDWRLPAIKVYLQLGFAPYLFLPEMKDRWLAVYEKLNWPAELEIY